MPEVKTNPARPPSGVKSKPHLLAAARHIERNPVRTGLVGRAADWAWSSAGAHVRVRDDGLVRVAPLLDRTAGWVCTWEKWLTRDGEAAIRERLQLHERTGRPMGEAGFLERLERILGRRLSPGKPGRPPKEAKAAPGHTLSPDCQTPRLGLEPRT